MPLPSPILDDRSYQQLRDELVRRIPVYTPEWTDHNASDPGITLIELFAFLGENLLFRFNQIPEATRLAFLRLLQIPLRPARPGRALLVLRRTDTGAAGILVRRGSEARAGSLAFETTGEITVHALEARAYARIRTDPPEEGDIRDHTQATLDRLGIGEDQAAYYETVQIPESPSPPGATPVDLADAVDGALWIAVLRTEFTVEAELRGAILNVAFVPDELDPTIDDAEPCPCECGCGGEPEAEDDGDIVWHATRPQRDPPVEQQFYVTLKTVSNTTRGYSRQGVIRLELPEDETPGVVKLDDPFLQGTGDFPPVIEDDEIRDRVLFWLHASEPAALREASRGVVQKDASRTSRSLGRVLFVGLNATEVEQAVTAPLEFLGTGDADANQEFDVHNRPVIQGSMKLEVEEAGAWTPWSVVDSFDASHPDSRHCTIDLQAGRVRFGNGERGRTPQIGERIRVKTYRYGGGREGNVAAEAISKLPDFSALQGLNPLPARGGADAETLQAGLDRVPGELRRRDRAVTADDFQELAMATPGADLGRADCIARFHPPTLALEKPGMVTVVVWPREDRKHPGAPIPDRTTLEQVCAWLDSRRLITTELYVIPPTYRKVAVAVGIKAKPGYGIEALRNWVELAIRQYLAPLPPYGPEGKGWPLGRRVYGPELQAAALQVEGVEYLEGLDTAEWNAQQGAWMPKDEILLARWEVPELSVITVVPGKPLPVGEALAPAAPPQRPLPVPKPSEEC